MMYAYENRTRRGSALVLSTIVVLIIAGMSISLTNLTIGRFGEQKRRQDQVDLLAATESAANEALNWLKVNTAAQDLLKALPISTHAYPVIVSGTSNSAVLDSDNLPVGMAKIYPELAVGSVSNKAGVRNNCVVDAKIIKVYASATPATWDGSERFIIYTTARAGDSSRPGSVRRQRVEAVITAKSTTTSTSVSTVSTAYPFTRGLFAINGFDFSGNATTDSWKSDPDGDGVHDKPYVAPTSYTVGDANSHGDLGSNGILGSGAYDTGHVHGTATPSVAATLPTVTYPPTSPATSSKISGDATLKGTSSGTTIFQVPSVNQKNTDTLTITGSGTVVLYVDGTFDVGNINFDPTSTAKLVIYQNDIGGKGCSFNAKNTIGDPADPSRFIFISGFSGTGSNEMSMNGGNSFSGVVYAPNAGIKFNGGSNFYGAFVGKDFSDKVNGNFGFHYDESLAGLSFGTITTTTTTTTTALSLLAPTVWNITNLLYSAP